MNASRERVAWVVIWLSLATFCLLVVAVPLGARAYVLNAESRQVATVESLLGTVVLEPPTGSGPIPLGKNESRPVSEGAIIRVDETSEAVVTFFDFSNVRLSRGTTVRIDRLRAPRYRWGVSPATIHLALVNGRMHVGTALALEAPLDFRVGTMHGALELSADGSYVVESYNSGADVTANRGSAVVRAQGQTVALEAHQRTLVPLSQPPTPPTDAARDLLVNGDFMQPLSEGWRVFNDQGTDGGSVDGTAEVIVDEGRRAVRFLRVGGAGNHCETILEQRVDRELHDLTSLVLRAHVKVRHQSLSGGGYLSSEYPLMVRITYRDAYDSEAEWIQGFYYQNVDGNPTTYGQEIPHDQWVPFESPNLLETLPIHPYRIMRIRLYASGWDYESLISDVSLTAE